MTDFFRFPQTPHLIWLAKDCPRDDKVLSSNQAEYLLAESVVVEEKLDGANLGISLDEHGNIQCQNRGQYILQPYSGQFSRLNGWLEQNKVKLLKYLDFNIILFGEWCAAKHTISYNHLTDWFYVFDVYDQQEKKFWSIKRRNNLIKKIGLKQVPIFLEGKASITELKTLLFQRSLFSESQVEGLIIRREVDGWCQLRAKIVRPDFSQSINEHWKKRIISWNSLRSK